MTELEGRLSSTVPSVLDYPLFRHISLREQRKAENEETNLAMSALPTPAFDHQIRFAPPMFGDSYIPITVTIPSVRWSQPAWNSKGVSHASPCFGVRCSSRRAQTKIVASKMKLLSEMYEAGANSLAPFLLKLVRRGR